MLRIGRRAMSRLCEFCQRHGLTLFSHRRRRRYFESLFPEVIESKELTEVPGAMDDLRRTRAQAAQDAADAPEVDIDCDPNMADFTGHTAPVTQQLFGHRKRLLSRWTDTNGLVADAMQDHRELDLLNVWTAEEEGIFFKR